MLVLHKRQAQSCKLKVAKPFLQGTEITQSGYVLSDDLSCVAAVAVGPRDAGSRQDFFLTWDLQSFYQNLMTDLNAFSLSSDCRVLLNIYFNMPIFAQNLPVSPQSPYGSVFNLISQHYPARSFLPARLDFH